MTNQDLIKRIEYEQYYFPTPEDRFQEIQEAIREVCNSDEYS